jgi:hypothetical protein
MSDYMKNQGLVDAITGCRNRQRELEARVTEYDTFAAAYCMGAMAHGATKEEARRELQQAWKDYCGCTT